MLFWNRRGVISLLDSDYEDLHGMGMEAMVQFIDDYLKGGGA